MAILLSLPFLFLGPGGVACGFAVVLFGMPFVWRAEHHDSRANREAETYVQVLSPWQVHQNMRCQLEKWGFRGSRPGPAGETCVDILCERDGRDYCVRFKLPQTRTNVPSLRSFVLNTQQPGRVFASIGGFSKPAMRYARSKGLVLWGPREVYEVIKGAQS